MANLVSKDLPTYLVEIVPLSNQPIKRIPKYIFENCNQVTCNQYQDFYLNLLKDRAKIITGDDLEKMCGERGDNFIKKGEEFDWIYALDALEQEFLIDGRPVEEILKVETVMKYNGFFSRLANDSPGAFRTKDIVWPKGNFEINATLASSVFDVEFTRQTGKSRAQFFNQESQIKSCVVKKSWITTQYTKLQHEGFNIEAPESTKKQLKEHWHEIDISKAAGQWIKEQKRKNNTLDLVPWFKARYHHFPPAPTLPEDLQNSLAALKDEQMHPVMKACRIWFDIVRIHISHEANKRTGKALASIILLKAGYLPPKIGKEDEKEYLMVMKLGIEEKDGYLRLVEFVAKNIIRTQQEYAHLKEG